MFKKFLAVFFAALMIFTIGCSKKEVYDNSSTGKQTVETDAKKDEKESKEETSEEKQEETPNKGVAVNPLTGVVDLDSEEKANQRPVAIMIENSNISIPVQTGLSKADVIYETETEGGITRLMAVYQDISSLERIGNIRSARYAYVDLALGHNAVYIHCGQDPTYCAPHLKNIDDMSVDGKFDKKSADGAQRYQNGTKGDEHKLYVWAGDLWSSINKKFNTTMTNAPLWQDFTDEKLTLEDGSATSVSIPFPASTTKFTYDSSTGLYTRMTGSKEHTDYYTKEKTKVKNVFILLTSMTNYSDGIHRKISLEGGKGYYITNGTVQEIKWSKGAANNGFTFTDTDGNEIKVSAGNSWVAIANKSTCKPVIK